MNVEVQMAQAFLRAFKRLHDNQKDAVEVAIAVIVEDPLSGDATKGDLAGVYGYKFGCIGQQYFLAYEYDPPTRVLLLVGMHENFYRQLKH